MPVDVLAIAAHPDDVELTCAGTLLALKARGRRFGIVDLTSRRDGHAGRRGAARPGGPARGARSSAPSSARPSTSATAACGTRARTSSLLIDVIRRERPRLVLTSYPEDRHPDHARAGRLVADAAFYAGLRKIETAHPAHRPQQTVFFSTALLHEPHFVVDVTPYWAKRYEAIQAFASQLHDPSSKEPQTMLSQAPFLATIEARARHFGFLIGVEFGEGFRSTRPPRIDDLVQCFEGFEAGF